MNQLNQQAVRLHYMYLYRPQSSSPLVSTGRCTRVCKVYIVLLNKELIWQRKAANPQNCETGSSYFDSYNSKDWRNRTGPTEESQPFLTSQYEPFRCLSGGCCSSPSLRNFTYVSTTLWQRFPSRWPSDSPSAWPCDASSFPPIGENDEQKICCTAEASDSQEVSPGENLVSHFLQQWEANSSALCLRQFMYVDGKSVSQWIPRFGVKLIRAENLPEEQ